VIPISQWYAMLGQFSLPTIFVQLREEEKNALLERDLDSNRARKSISRLHGAIRNLPGGCFVSGDVCAPIDSDHFGKSGKVSYGRTAWRLLASSSKVTEAFKAGKTNRITVRPFRRMNRTREFRMFIYGSELKAVSQYHVERHFHRLAGKEKEIWRRTKKFTSQIRDFLPRENIVVDIYITSENQVLIVDLNSWGAPTDPLLFKIWNRDWERELGVKLLPHPIHMDGDISVSF